MPRHRVPSATSRVLTTRVLTTVAVAGAALGTSVLIPATANAAPLGETGSELAPGAHLHHHQHDADDSGSTRSHHRHHTAARLRPMSSGEQQYRNGCRHGYITDNCGAFSVPGLLGRGINPTI
jgi:hypothetical protein